MTYYPINEDAARRAKNMNSFSDYKEGSATASYRKAVDEAAALAERQKARVDPMYHEKIDRLLDLYARKLEAKLAKLEKHQELMKAANAAIRMKDKEKGDKRLAELGYTPEEIAELRAPDFAGRIGYPAYALQNNNANIRRIRERVEELKKRQTEPAPEGWEFDGGQVVVNTDENRLQIIFDGKPDADLRAELKSEGFRWAPSQGAWQRQLTDNAFRAARRIEQIAPIC